MMSALLAMAAPVAGPIVIGWAGGAFAARHSAKRKAAAEAAKVEAETEQVEAAAENTHAQTAQVVTATTLQALIALRDENERLRKMLEEQRAASSGLLEAYAHSLAAQVVAPTSAAPTLVVLESHDETTRRAIGAAE